jgi:hypothetical protein
MTIFNTKILFIVNRFHKPRQSTWVLRPFSYKTAYLYPNVIFVTLIKCRLKSTGAVYRNFSRRFEKRTQIGRSLTVGGSNQTAITQQPLDRFRCGILYCNGKWIPRRIVNVIVSRDRKYIWKNRRNPESSYYFDSNSDVKTWILLFYGFASTPHTWRVDWLIADVSVDAILWRWRPMNRKRP